VNINDGSVSSGWGHTLLWFVEHGLGAEIQPMTLVIKNVQDDLDHLEDVQVRAEVDAILSRKGHKSVGTTASTIFPASLWNRTLRRAQLFDSYERNWPRIKKLGRNYNGTYFYRMINYPEGLRGGERNQLEYIIR